MARTNKIPKYLPAIPKGFRQYKDTHVFCGRNGRVVVVKKNGRVLLLDEYIGAQGYKVFSISKNNITTPVYTHHVISWCWLGPKPSGLQVNHKNTIKTDNRVVNLEYITQGDNVRHAYKAGLGPHGERHPQSVLKECDVIKIRKLIESNSIGDIAKQFNVSNTSIWNVVNRETWNHI